MIEVTQTKQCTKCKTTKPIDQFDFKRKGKLWRRGRCKACETARKKQWIGRSAYMQEYRKHYLMKVQQTPEYKEKVSNKAKALRTERRRLYETGQIRPADTKTCRRCGETKIKDLFSLDFNRSDLLGTYCKKCISKMRKEYQRRKDAP